jgi:hypothetical protein
MADVILPVQQLTGNVSLVEETITHLNNFYYNNDGKTYVRIDNRHSGSVEVVLNAVGECDQDIVHSLTLTIPASSFIYFGNLDKHWFNQTDTTFIGKVKITFNGDLTGLTGQIGAYRI